MDTREVKEIEASADEAWEKYLSCCRFGGTDEERSYAYKRWQALDSKADHLRKMIEKR
jgi:hypothetical protein